MRKIYLLGMLVLAVCATSLLRAPRIAAQTSQTQCLQSGIWVPCTSIAYAQVVQVNVKTGGGSGTTLTNAFGSSTTAGNTIICLAEESSAAAPTVTDGQSNTYAAVTMGATAPGYAISVAQNITGGTTDTITETVASNAYAAFVCYEVKGQAYVGQAWSLAAAAQGTGTSITFPAALAAGPGELILAAVGLGAGTVNATPSLGGQSTGLVTVDALNATTGLSGALSVWYAGHASMSQARAFTQTVSLSASETYTGIIASVRVSSLPVAIVNPISVPGVVTQMPAQQFTTYAASKTGLVPASSATDIAVLSGNATNTVIPTYVSLSCTQTTAGITPVQLFIRTTADTSGTSTGSPASFPLDQNNTAAVSAVLTYTANPTVNDGTARLIDSQNVGILAPATAVPNDIYIWRPKMGQSVVLRGTAQQLALNLDANTVSGGSCSVAFQWIEAAGL